MNKELITELRNAAFGGHKHSLLMLRAADALEEAERKLAIARKAMQNLVAVKGRYHTEQAYNRVVEALAQIGEKP